MFDYLSFLFLSFQILTLNWADQVKPYSPLFPFLSLMVAIVVGVFTVANVIHHW
ncbi:hypothetical protein [Pseudomonas siliginis]|uniref:hypothetical protein n=1 Tax=Pseudomonas siliginis TaxID=2842346 RepID=UPI002093DE7B|nr:hypothetical protein [Pseudomonas siliginis]UST77214.1 hypothetical protein NF676_00090 [Pseudomonas siliginis]